MIVDVSQFVPLAKQLDQKSDKLNDVVMEVNSKILALNLGVEAWCATYLQTDDYEEETNFYTDRVCRYRVVTHLGYAQSEDGWQLVIRRIREAEDGAETQETLLNISPLLEASRAIRAKALGMLPSLFEAIQREAKTLLAGIEAGEKAAAAL
jgi:hypothetical protein